MNREQELIDLMFEMVMVTKQNTADCAGFSLNPNWREANAKWIAHNLRECGFDTEPCGMSWGVLKK